MDPELLPTIKNLLSTAIHPERLTFGICHQSHPNDTWDTLDEFKDIIDDYTDWYNKKNIFFMGFHPLNPANEEEQEFLVTPNGSTPIVESDLEYSMMLIQKFSQLQESSDKLHRQGYYKLWPKGYYRDVVVSRQKTYRRIFGGQDV